MPPRVGGRYETSSQLTVVKLDADADLVWNRFFSQGIFGYRVAVDSAGDVIVAGVESPTETFFLDWVTLKLAPDGTLRWSQAYNGAPSLDERPWALDLDSAGGIYVTGDGGPTIRQGGFSYLQLVTVKYTPSGSVEWIAVNGNGRGIAVRVANAEDAVFVQSLYDMLTLRLSNTGTPPPPPPPLIAPSALRVTGTTRTEVRLAWTNQDPDQTAVGVERCPGAGCTNFAEVARLSGTASSYRNVARQPQHHVPLPSAGLRLRSGLPVLEHR